MARRTLHLCLYTLHLHHTVHRGLLQRGHCVWMAMSTLCTAPWDAAAVAPAVVSCCPTLRMATAALLLSWCMWCVLLSLHTTPWAAAYATWWHTCCCCAMHLPVLLSLLSCCPCCAMHSAALVLTYSWCMHCPAVPAVLHVHGILSYWL